MTRSLLRRAASWAVRYSDYLALLVLVATSIPPVLVRHGSLTAIPTFNFLDGSWLLDASYKAAGGIWLGRDAAFTYGPLFQGLSSAPARWIGISTGAIYATWYTLPLILIVVATFWTARLLLPEIAAWRRALLLLLAIIFWSPPDLRISLALLAFAIFLRMTDAVVPGKGMVLRATATAAICIAAFWLSADTGLYCAAAFLLCVLWTAAVRPQPARLAILAIVTAGIFAALVLVTNLALFSLFDFQFWRSSLAIASGYRWFEPMAMTKPDKRLVLESLALAIAVFATVSWWRMPGRTRTRRPAFLLSGFCLAILILQSALVRSDHGHVVIGIYPILFLCGAIAMDEFDAPLLSMACPAAALLATIVLASAYPLYTPADVLSRWRHMVHPVVTCGAGSREFDRACLSAGAAELLTSVSQLVNSQTNPGDIIGIFPYETAFGLASRHQVAGGLLQSYIANGEYLTDLELAGLRHANSAFTLYFPDGVVTPDGVISVGVDDVPNFTRSPEVWFYLLQHYRAAGSPAPGVLGLIRDDTRAARLSLVDEGTAGPAGPISIRTRSSSIELALRHWPAAGADFIKTRLRLNYPLWWRMRKPSKLAFRLTFADGSERTIQFVVQPDHLSDIWIYPWDAREMGTYFSDDAGQWRRDNRPTLTSLKLLVNPYDWISVIPNSITMEKIEAVKLQMK